MTTNSLAFIALCNEYCAAVEHARESGHDDFTDTMLRLLPRLYISATDLHCEVIDPDIYLADALDEDYYESVRRAMEEVLGEDDAYLEVFEEDMKYSDTPIAASVSEGLADIFQVLYNFIDTVRDAPESLADDALALVKEDFGSYWSKPLCNVLRALNNIKY
ncbi:MAG: DUF5063 domain-containing protein [Muribaculaceae bacterium]|nr:DUF5063 domain-containing protein [Muribaculaceae bacterium]MDE5928939.1 DUF5063 domain-containing protein [Muribaculaceae bacterium]MDE6131151.1 DUF5063 domain-containing protein [Muribaculaceae bacterium]